MADDFIRRSEAMNKINDIAAEFLKDHTIQCDIAAGVAIDIKNDVIKTLPAADVVEVVHAYWDKDPVTGVKLCSNCNAPPPGDAELDKFYESDYCPCCGAKMDGKINPSAPTE